MPIYEYVCTGCESKFELLRPVDRRDDAAMCPTCRKSGRRILSVFASFTTDSEGVPVPVGGGGCACGGAGCGCAAMS